MDPLTLSATPKAWLLNSVLGPHAGAFVAHLKHGRYSPSTRRTYLGSLAHLARWMTQCCLSLRLLDESAVERFLARHVPHCDCPRPVIRTRSDLRAACAHLLDVLREQHVISERPREVGHIADELRRYDDYMRRAQGLIEGTRGSRLRIVQRLLLHKFADGPVVIGELQPDDVRKFIAQQLDLRSTTSNATTIRRDDEAPLPARSHQSEAPSLKIFNTYQNIQHEALVSWRARTDCFGACGPSSFASLRTAAAPCAAASNLAEDSQVVEPPTTWFEGATMIL